MKYSKATEEYTRWLQREVDPDLELFAEQIKEKDRKMSEGAFPFLRGTFYRWAELWPETCPKLAGRREDTVMAIGDLHIENFGTWRDAEHRLVWGVNDFDEAHELTFTCDLVRLATSALAAAKDHSIALEPEEVASRILKGYREGCAEGGSPFILDSAHQILRDLIDHALADDDVDDYWKKLRKEKNYPLSTNALPVPKEVKRLLEASLPPDTQAVEYRVVVKAKGLGSLGRPRYVAIGEWNGGAVAREAKRLAPSAVEWLTAPNSTRIFVEKLAQLSSPVRSADPTYQVHGSWIVRALGPDAVKVELKELPSGMDMRAAILFLLEPMGRETANIHLGSASAVHLRKSLKELDAVDSPWLAEAAAAMWEATREDWKAFS